MLLFFLFFKQKTAYEVRSSDWSSDVCSSDLTIDGVAGGATGSSVPITGSFRTRMGASTADTPANFWKGSFRDLLVTSALNDEQAALLETYLMRSEERRDGKECVSTCRSRWQRDH